jgi:hypothetical protein
MDPHVISKYIFYIFLFYFLIANVNRYKAHKSSSESSTNFKSIKEFSEQKSLKRPALVKSLNSILPRVFKNTVILPFLSTQLFFLLSLV